MLVETSRCDVCCGPVSVTWSLLQLFHVSCLQIDAVSTITLINHNQLAIYKIQLLYKYPLNIFLFKRDDEIAVNGQIPNKFISLCIPRLNVSSASIVIWRDIAHTIVNYWVNFRSLRALRLGKARCHQSKESQNDYKGSH
jgi:hypothetical protein